MKRHFELRLPCCQARHRIRVDLDGVRQGILEDTRKTVDCPYCNHIVIVTLGEVGGELSIIDHEIVDWQNR